MAVVEEGENRRGTKEVAAIQSRALDVVLTLDGLREHLLVEENSGEAQFGVLEFELDEDGVHLVLHRC